MLLVYHMTIVLPNLHAYKSADRELRLHQLCCFSFNRLLSLKMKNLFSGIFFMFFSYWTTMGNIFAAGQKLPLEVPPKKVAVNAKKGGQMSPVDAKNSGQMSSLDNPKNGNQMSPVDAKNSGQMSSIDNSKNGGQMSPIDNPKNGGQMPSIYNPKNGGQMSPNGESNDGGQMSAMKDPKNGVLLAAKEDSKNGRQMPANVDPNQAEKEPPLNGNMNVGKPGQNPVQTGKDEFPIQYDDYDPFLLEGSGLQTVGKDSSRLTLPNSNIFIPEESGHNKAGNNTSQGGVPEQDPFLHEESVPGRAGNGTSQDILPELDPFIPEDRGLKMPVNRLQDNTPKAKLDLTGPAKNSHPVSGNSQEPLTTGIPEMPNIKGAYQVKPQVPGQDMRQTCPCGSLGLGLVSSSGSQVTGRLDKLDQIAREINGQGSDEDHNNRGRPWIVHIAIDTLSKENKFCSGVLLNRLYIISAAHCFCKNVEGLTCTPEHQGFTKNITVGDRIAIRFNIPDKEYKRFPQATITIHEDYYQALRGDNQHPTPNDIALINMGQALDLDQLQLQPICLPKEIHNPIFPEESSLRENSRLYNWDLDCAMEVYSFKAIVDGCFQPGADLVDIPPEERLSLFESFCYKCGDPRQNSRSIITAFRTQHEGIKQHSQRTTDDRGPIEHSPCTSKCTDSPPPPSSKICQNKNVTKKFEDDPFSKVVLVGDDASFITCVNTTNTMLSRKWCNATKLRPAPPGSNQEFSLLKIHDSKGLNEVQGQKGPKSEKIDMRFLPQWGYCLEEEEEVEKSERKDVIDEIEVETYVDKVCARQGADPLWEFCTLRSFRSQASSVVYLNMTSFEQLTGLAKVKAREAFTQVNGRPEQHQQRGEEKAGGGGTFCYGDGGGAVWKKHGEKAFLTGLVSRHEKTCKAFLTNRLDRIIHTRLALHLSWIFDHIQDGECYPGYPY